MQELPAGRRQSPKRHPALLLSSRANQKREAGGDHKPQKHLRYSPRRGSGRLERARVGLATALAGIGKSFCISAPAVNFQNSLAPLLREAAALAGF
ncbi:hypothetical protein STEG23_032672 [Scotinomys teguina]